VVLRPEHIELTQQRLTIRLDMPPPLLVAEVVSPGKINRDRDYRDKRAQYQARQIPEYWLIDPEEHVVVVLTLSQGVYQESRFTGSEMVLSPSFPGFARSAEAILTPPE
jgi:Uma2 family endonuclease